MPLNCNNKKSDDAQESEVEAAMKTILEEGAGAVGTPNQTGVAQNPLDGVVVVMGQAQTSGCDRQTSVAPNTILFYSDISENKTFWICLKVWMVNN